MDQKEESFIDRARGTANLAVLVAKVISVPAEVLLHFDVGERYIGPSALAALVLMMFFPVLFPSSNPAPLLLLALAFVLRGACLRAVVLWRYFKGIRPVQHTKRCGVPWLQRLLPRWSLSSLLWIEGPLCAVLGTGVAYINKPLGFFLMLSGWALLVITGLRAVMNHNSATDIHDRMLEQQGTAESLRAFQQAR